MDTDWFVCLSILLQIAMALFANIELSQNDICWTRRTVLKLMDEDICLRNMQYIIKIGIDSIMIHRIYRY